MNEYSLRRRLRQEPNNPQHIIELALLLKDSGRMAETEVYLRQALELEPTLVEGHVHLGALLMDFNRLSEAADVFRCALALGDRSAETALNLGSVLQGIGQLTESAQLLRFACKTNPASIDAHIRLAVTLTELHQLAEAEAILSQAQKMQSTNHEINYLLANIHFLQGRNEQAWPNYEARIRVHGIYQPKLRRWQGQKLAGKTILLYHEQGFGDSIQYLRYVPAVSELADTTVLWLQKPLQRLLSGQSGTFITHRGDELPSDSFDYACPLLSLPLIYQTLQQTFPKQVPYIKASSAISQHWRNFLAATFGNNKPTIGIVWSGNSLHKRDAQRSIAFDLLRPLFFLEQFNWISLQTSAPLSQNNSPCTTVRDISPYLTDFAETAGVIDNLDLIITVDTAVAHLAGAMGKPTWLLLPFHPDPRWQLDRNDSPWYPSLQLFRQAEAGNWQSVITVINSCLCQQQLYFMSNRSTSINQGPFTK